MRDIVLIAHNIRSTHNIGSILRTAEGFGVSHVYLSGYTAYPTHPNDTRLPHISRKLSSKIHKTALGAEELQAWSHEEDVRALIDKLKHSNYTIIGLEQSPGSVKLNDYRPPDKVAMLLGSEVNGIEPELLSQCDRAIEINMYGQKESFNVAQAAAIALYSLRETK